MVMKYFEDVESMEIAPLNREGVNAFLEDVVSSEDDDSPITCGLFRMEAGMSFECVYSCDECQFILQGEMTVTEDGLSKKVFPGDVLYFDKGTAVTFSSNSFGLAFYVGQREKGSF